jgi:hypothetical protein
VAQYHKGYRSSGNIKIIHWYAPKEVGELLVYYLWLVLPFWEKLQYQMTGRVVFSASKKKEHRQWAGPRHGKGKGQGKKRGTLARKRSRRNGRSRHGHPNGSRRSCKGQYSMDGKPVQFEHQCLAADRQRHITAVLSRESIRRRVRELSPQRRVRVRSQVKSMAHSNR